MSHSVEIDYRALSIEARKTCEHALKQLCKLDTLISKINETSASLQTQKIVDFETYLKNQKEKLTSTIHDLVKKTGQSHRDAGIASTARKLSDYVNELTSTQLLNLEDMIDEELQQVAQRRADEIHDEIHGIVSINPVLIEKINGIDDFILRESVYKEAVKKENKSLPWEKILALGSEKLTERTEQVVLKNREKIIKEFTTEMKEAKVEEAIIQQVMSNEIKQPSDLVQLRKTVTQEIVNESVRKETLKVIIKTIETRDFVVDRKNIKLNRETNEVRLVAMKVSGERAEFRIFLDGKFIYTFDGYEGQACQKDIQPFMKDLSDIYDIEVVKQVENWSNPDKISTMKYQTVDKNKGKR